MTWVLIVFFLVSNTSPIAIPGYNSEAECEKAGAVTAERGDKYRRTRYICVPGPHKPAPHG